MMMDLLESFMGNYSKYASSFPSSSLMKNALKGTTKKKALKFDKLETGKFHESFAKKSCIKKSNFLGFLSIFQFDLENSSQFLNYDSHFF